MTLEELKEKIDKYYDYNNGSYRDWDICIPNNAGGVGGTSVTYIKGLGFGFDWDHGKAMLIPETKMVNKAD